MESEGVRTTRNVVGGFYGLHLNPPGGRLGRTQQALHEKAGARLLCWANVHVERER